MEKITNNSGDLQSLTFLNILVIILSFLMILIFVIQYSFPIPNEINRLLNVIDDLICLVFLYDFCNGFAKSSNKISFLKWGWLDLLSSIPSFDLFRLGRLARLIRLLRILRLFKSLKIVTNHLFKDKKKGAFSSVLIIAILTLVLSSVLILHFENVPRSNIKTAEDALWWVCSTMSTVGYGDLYPITSEGRVVGVFLMIVGGGLFATLSGYCASWFLYDQSNNKLI